LRIHPKLQRTEATLQAFRDGASVVMYHPRMATESGKPKSRYEGIAHAAGYFALAMSLITVVATWPPLGDVKVFSTSAYGILRGLDQAPSDHLVVPLDWSNTERRPVRIYDVKLAVGGKNYLLAGELDSIGPVRAASNADLLDKLRYRSSLVLPGDSQATRVLVFHISDWWGSEANPTPSSHHFVERDERARAVLTYRKDSHLARIAFWMSAEGELPFAFPFHAGAKDIPQGGRDFFWQ
jgi:hypothetical protein